MYQLLQAGFSNSQSRCNNFDMLSTKVCSSAHTSRKSVETTTTSVHQQPRVHGHLYIKSAVNLHLTPAMTPITLLRNKQRGPPPPQ